MNTHDQVVESEESLTPLQMFARISAKIEELQVERDRLCGMVNQTQGAMQAYEAVRDELVKMTGSENPTTEPGG